MTGRPAAALAGLALVCAGAVLAPAFLAPAFLAPALAQTADASPCVLDDCTAARFPRAAVGTTAPSSFDFYVLSLSWSPGFCATGGDGKAKDQCAIGRGLGFVVHGLWPQNTHGFPGDCGPAGRYPSRQALDTVRGLYPDEGLARYEWRKHGACTGQSPTDYFADVRRARTAVSIPLPFTAPAATQTWAPVDVARAFAAANPGLRTDEMAVTCRSGTLAEVRVCFAKDLRSFVPCPEVARASCRAPGLDVPPVR